MADTQRFCSCCQVFQVPDSTLHVWAAGPCIRGHHPPPSSRVILLGLNHTHVHHCAFHSVMMPQDKWAAYLCDYGV